MIAIYKEIQPVDILAIGIHPDDVELCASGTLLSQIASGYRVGICDLTQGELGTLGDADTRKRESRDAAEIMDISFRINLEMRDGFSQVDAAHILQIAEIIRLSRPKIVLANALDDRHPDHPRGAKLVREAFFFSGLRKITSIEGAPHRADVLYHYIQDIQLQPDICVDVSAHIEKKWEAIGAYKTQFNQPPEQAIQTPISSVSFLHFLEAKMRIFGRSIGVEYAEGFNMNRPIGTRNLMHLI